MGNFLFSKLVKISLREGIYIASQKSARWQTRKVKNDLLVDRATYSLSKICRWQTGKVKNDLPVDRPVDRRNGHISDRCASSRPPVDQLAHKSGVLSVDRLRGRLAVVAGLCARLVHIGRPIRPTDHLSGRPSSRPPVWSGWKL